VALAPQALRRAGLVGRLAAIVPTADHADVVVAAPTGRRSADGVIDTDALAATLADVRASTAAILRDGKSPLLVGGDCPILLGALAACQDVTGSSPGLLFVDGHEDAWPPWMSLTGEAADMEFGWLLGWSVDGLGPALRAQVPRVDPAHVAVLGPRDRAELLEAGVRLVDGVVPLLDDRAIRTDPARAGLESVRGPADAPAGWWLHVDLDVLSTDALPAVDYQQPGGLWAELTTLVTAAIARGGCIGATVTIYNPDHDPGTVHAPRIVEFLVELARAGLDSIHGGDATHGLR
jgi:arginase